MKTYLSLVAVCQDENMSARCTDLFRARNQDGKSTPFFYFDPGQVHKDGMFVSYRWQKALGFGQH